jgi:hypothetical protein
MRFGVSAFQQWCCFKYGVITVPLADPRTINSYTRTFPLKHPYPSKLNIPSDHKSNAFNREWEMGEMGTNKKISPEA